jgi:hypothetical protein
MWNIDLLKQNEKHHECNREIAKGKEVNYKEGKEWNLKVKESEYNHNILYARMEISQ